MCSSGWAGLEEQVRALRSRDPHAMGTAAVGDAIGEIGELIDLLEAERLRLLVTFDRSGGARADGSPTTASWLRDRAGLPAGAAHDRVKLARELADSRHVTAEALAAGRITFSAAKEIALGLADLPDPIPDGAAEAVEPALVEAAPGLRPGTLRQALAEAVEAVAPGAALKREQRRHAERSLSLVRLGSGWDLRASLTNECGAALDAALSALLRADAAPPPGQARPPVGQRRHDALHDLARSVLDTGHLPAAQSEPTAAPGAAPTGGAQPGSAGEGADGFELGFEPRLFGGEAPPTGEPAASGGSGGLRLPDGGGERPHLTVIADLAALRPAGLPLHPTRPTPLAQLAGTGPISTDHLRRIACDATLTRVLTTSQPGAPPPGQNRERDQQRGAGLLGPGDPPETIIPLSVEEIRALLPPSLGGPASTVLDVGHRYRTAPPHLRRAVVARDRTCRWPGCTAPPERCEVHHLIHWADGGATALENLALQCWTHHRFLHEGGWTIQLDAYGCVTVIPPEQTQRLAG